MDWPAFALANFEKKSTSHGRFRKAFCEEGDPRSAVVLGALGRLISATSGESLSTAVLALTVPREGLDPYRATFDSSKNEEE
jgi:hypothetical protein